VRPLRQPQVRLPKPVRVFGIVGRQIDEYTVFVGEAENIVETLAGVRTLKVNGRFARHQLRCKTELDDSSLDLTQRYQARARE